MTTPLTPRATSTSPPDLDGAGREQLHGTSGDAEQLTVAGCRECGGRGAERIGSYPAGDPRSQIVASYLAAEDGAATGADTHTHYSRVDDAFTVVRPLPREVPA